jgi:uncharacterized protein YeaO (DUF488 family)
MNANDGGVGRTGGFRVKRIYAPVEESDGFRVLVDRLWPRGMSRDRGRIDLWLKEVAPSETLRRRVHGDPSAWPSFVVDYAGELAQEPARSAVAILRERVRQSPVTLLFAARDEARNNAVALKDWLER